MEEIQIKKNKEQTLVQRNRWIANWFDKCCYCFVIKVYYIIQNKYDPNSSTTDWDILQNMNI